MKVYGVVLDEATEENLEVGKRIGQKYPDHYRLNETFYLIKTSYDNSLDVAHVIGIRGNDRIDGSGGVVFRLSQRYSGFAEGNLWEWLEDAFEEVK